MKPVILDEKTSIIFRRCPTSKYLVLPVMVSKGSFVQTRLTDSFVPMIDAERIANDFKKRLEEQQGEKR